MSSTEKISLTGQPQRIKATNTSKLLLLWAETNTLVQRVSKDTLVVKCHTDSQHPLGLLHLTVGAGGLPDISKSERRSREQQHAVFQCACQLSGRRSKAGVDGAGGSTKSDPPHSSVSPQPCLHFYACVCAFASDEKLASEFAAFINYTPSGTVTEPVRQS